jgi:hypothetical protein
MKVYLVERTDEVDYDEYDSFVVKAESKKEALKLCQTEADDWSYHQDTFRENNTKISELLNEGKKGIILGSFNRG